MSIREVSRAITRSVNSKVGTLQSGYLAGRSSSRASLARLRRLDTAGEASWMSVGEEFFADLPSFNLGEETERKELESVRAALQLYAILQPCEPPSSFTPFSSSRERALSQRFQLIAGTLGRLGTPAASTLQPVMAVENPG